MKLKYVIEDIIDFKYNLISILIKLNYGVFPKRQYDSPIVYGENLKITKILENYKKGINV